MFDYVSLMNPYPKFNWAALGALAFVYAIIGIAVYIYTAMALMTIAKKTGTKNGWLAFIPIANIYLLTQIVGISGWWTLGILVSAIPIVGGILVGIGMVYLYWKTAEKVGKPGWWGILMIIPIVGWVLLGIMAWGK